MKSRYFFAIFLLWCGACTDVEDASPSDRKTFIRMIEASRSLQGVAAEPVSDGYIVLANEVTPSGISALLIKTDVNGSELPGERVIIPRLIATALKVGAQGYYVTGNRVKINPASENLFDLSVSSALLYRITPGGDTTSYVAYDTISQRKTDFTGSAIAFDGDDNVVLLGTFRDANSTAHEQPFVTVLDPATLADTIWSKRYSVLDRDYVNAKSVHVNADGNLIWASALLKETGDLSRTYLSIPYIKKESVFLNNSIFGETTDQQLYINDIQPAVLPAFGYGVIGTYATPTGNNANMFFMRVDQNGNFISGSERFFDGATATVGVDLGTSATTDTGDALTSTQDGGFILAGSMTTTPDVGSGGKDILLIKIDLSGNILWSKILGGEGDETVNSIRETADGHLVICGTNNLSGLSSIFIMKTDKDGSLND